MNEKEKFREQLLLQEKANPEHQKNFQLEVKKMYTEKLKISQRIAHVLAALLISLFTLFFWAMSITFEGLQMKYDLAYIETLRLASKWAMFLSLALVLLSLWPAIRGKVGLRFYPKVIRFIFWILILAITAMYIGMLDIIQEGKNSPSIEISMVFTFMTLVVIMGTYMLLSGRIDRGDLQNKTKTLELEYRIAELEEKLNQSK